MGARHPPQLFTKPQFFEGKRANLFSPLVVYQMMTTEPNFLDGSVSLEGKGQRGNEEPIAHLYWTDRSGWVPTWVGLATGKVYTTTPLRYRYDFSFLWDGRLNKSIETKHASHLLGSREFTLTYSPKWFGDEEARRIFHLAIQRLVKYYEHEIIEMRAIGEVGSNGLSHVHCFYKLEGGLKMTDKNFRRAYPKWDTSVKQGHTGHQGGHHANVRTESDFKGYIEKDIDSAWLDISFPTGIV